MQPEDQKDPMEDETNDELAHMAGEELMAAIESKDKKQFLESLKALILNVE